MLFRSHKGDRFPVMLRLNFGHIWSVEFLRTDFCGSYVKNAKRSGWLLSVVKSEVFARVAGGRRMSETAIHLVDNVISHVRVRQWVVTAPYPLRFLMAFQPKVQVAVLRVIVRAINAYYRKKIKAEHGCKDANVGAVTLVQWR